MGFQRSSSQEWPLLIVCPAPKWPEVKKWAAAGPSFVRPPTTDPPPCNSPFKDGGAPSTTASPSLELAKTGRLLGSPGCNPDSRGWGMWCKASLCENLLGLKASQVWPGSWWRHQKITGRCIQSPRSLHQVGPSPTNALCFFLNRGWCALKARSTLRFRSCTDSRSPTFC